MPQNPLIETTKIANGALTAKAAIVLDNNNKANMPGGANAARFGGVCQAAAADTMPARIAAGGIVEVIAAAAFNPGELLTIADNTGKVQKAGATAGTVYNVIGIANEAAGASGDIVEMLIAPHTINAATT